MLFFHNILKLDTKAETLNYLKCVNSVQSILICFNMFRLTIISVV